jgi:hypothetical protein
MRLVLRPAFAPKSRSEGPNQLSRFLELEPASELAGLDDFFFFRALFLCERFDRRSELLTFV